MRRDQHQHGEPAHVGVPAQHREPLAERGARAAAAAAERPAARPSASAGPSAVTPARPRRPAPASSPQPRSAMKRAAAAPAGGPEQAPGPHPAVEPLRLAERVQVAEHHPELQHGQAAEKPRPHVERVDLEQVLAAQQQPEQQGHDGARPEQQAQPVGAARAPAAPGDLSDTDGDGGDREVHEREVRGGQPRQEQRVAGRLEQRVPRERAEDRQERGERAAPLLRADVRQTHQRLRPRSSTLRSRVPEAPLSLYCPTDAAACSRSWTTCCS